MAPIKPHPSYSAMTMLPALMLAGLIAISIPGCGQGIKLESAQGSGAARTDLQEKSVGGIELEPREALDGKVSLLVPAGFEPMSQAMLNTKYPSHKRPSLVFTNKDGTINVAIEHTQDRISPSQLGAAHRQIDAVFRQQFPNAKWYFSGLKKINGREWLQLDIQTPAIDTDVRNIIAATSIEARMLMVTFNVTKELESKWLDAGREVIKSLHVNE